MDETPKATAPAPAADSQHGGSDRRVADRPDRRRTARGGRRATDAIARVATFVYKLLTEPPR